MMRPDISICLLTWNRAEFLEICLREMFASFSTDSSITREILLMDNGSNDATADVLSKYANHPNVKIFRNKRNEGFNAYKKLFYFAKGRIIIDLDDDILKFPIGFDKTLMRYLEVYKDYGFLACNVIQNEKTDGRRPRDAVYKEDKRGDMIVEEGPTGGWCSAFRRRDWLWIKLLIFLFKMDAKNTEDVYIASLCWRLRKRIGIIKNAVCFHASGSVYAREANYLCRDISKYRDFGNCEAAKEYIAELQ